MYVSCTYLYEVNGGPDSLWFRFRWAQSYDLLLVPALSLLFLRVFGYVKNIWAKITRVSTSV